MFNKHIERSNSNNYFVTSLNDFEKFNKPDNFLNVDSVLINKIKVKLKQAYDFSKSEEVEFIISEVLSELIVNNFDLEQIWQQIELQNNILFSKSTTNISRLIIEKRQLMFKNLENEIADSKEEIDIIDNDYTEIEVKKKLNKNMDENSNSEDTFNIEVDEFNLNEQSSVLEEAGYKEKTTKTYKTSIVDDDFFKLAEMENFLNTEEKILQNSNFENNGLDESDSEIDNLFEYESDNEDIQMKTAKFKDFFKPKIGNENTHTTPFQQNEEELSNNNIKDDIKSSFELRQRRLDKNIMEIEKNAVSEKPWQMKGEVTANDRPENSLLEEILEFDLTTKPAPVITEQTSLQLEDIIRQRIKDKTFDSVIRKIKPIETPIEYKKKLVLDQEKSKHSLAQIYEKEFLEQQAAHDGNGDKQEVEPQHHVEIKNLMKNLFNKLDALSNFYFTPKPIIPEVKIINNLPAIHMEEVAPIANSEATLLAPEEIKNKAKGEILGKSERSATDKNRERRKKKLKQRAHLKEKLIKEKEKNLSSNNKFQKTREEKSNKVKHDKKTSKVTNNTTNSKNIKSSKEFFTQLQDIQKHGGKHQGKKIKNDQKYKMKF